MHTPSCAPVVGIAGPPVKQQISDTLRRPANTEAAPSALLVSWLESRLDSFVMAIVFSLSCINVSTF